jgi:glutamine amidotransferase
MCEILGITALREFDVTSVLKQFYAHSVEHPDGWGLAVLGKSMPCVEKEPNPAFRSDYLKARLSVPLYADCVLGHIRKASVGKNEYRNCHPFIMQDNRGRCWTLMHNGTVFHETDASKYAAMQQGDTDSERILCALIDRIDRRQTELHRKLRFPERFRLIEDLMSGLAEGNQLNVMIHDGEMLYVHANLPGRLFVHQTEEQVIIATSPLWEHGWEPVPLCTLLAYQSGRLIRTVHSHGYAYDFSRDPQTEQQALQNEFSLL